MPAAGGVEAAGEGRRDEGLYHLSMHTLTPVSCLLSPQTDDTTEVSEEGGDGEAASGCAVMPLGGLFLRSYGWPSRSTRGVLGAT